MNYDYNYNEYLINKIIKINETSNKRITELEEQLLLAQREIERLTKEIANYKSNEVK